MNRTILRFLAAAALAAGLAAGPGAGPVRAASYKLVAHASNPVSSLSAAQVERLFLKKVTRWDDGSEVQPVDLAADSPVRSAFSRDLLGKDVAAIKSYWQKMIFSGRATPPPELSTDAQVLEFVRSNPGAIGYVSAGTAVGDGVEVIKLNQ
jgi:ABC-type phosphate transport system substrate-binding protein